MKVAIMGAGISGLSCAIALETQGVTPYIFEKRTCVGDRFVNAESMFHILNRPIRDCLSHLRDEYGIVLKPTARVRQIVLHSKNESGRIRGSIGYTNNRGRREDSYEMQLKNHVKAPIEYNSDYEYPQLCKEFDRVVLATGDADYACQLGNYRSDLCCTVRGATVEGRFDKNTPHVWFEYDIMPKGYGWVIPFSDREANLVMLYPDFPSAIRMDIDLMWEQFREKVETDMKQNFTITDKFEVTKYMVGICSRPKIETTYFVGNCFGAISPGLGFGQFTSILTGVYSAYDICGLADYEELVKPLYKNYERSLVLRRFLEGLNNDELDLAIKSSNIKLIQMLMDRLCDVENGSQFLRNTAPLLKLINTLKGNE